MPKVAELNALYPTNCEVLLQVRSEYAGWNWTYHKGYIRYNLKGSLFYEHQLVASLGYHASISNKQIHVHHKDENKLNNNFANLLMLSNADHQHLHPKDGNRIPCANCGETLKRVPARAAERKYNFCKRACYIEFANKIGGIGKYSKVAA